MSVSTFKKTKLAIKKQVKRSSAAILKHILPIYNKKLLFVSWGGANFNCNPKALCTYINTTYPRQYKIIVSIGKRDIRTQLIKDYPDIIFVKEGSVRYGYHAFTAKTVVSNIRYDFWFKRKNQKYIQTWHGTGPKIAEKDSLSVLDNDYAKLAIADCRRTDLMLSGSGYFTRWIQNSTWYEGKILESGMPRSDCFFRDNGQLKKQILTSLGLSDDTKLLLYAPSFRSQSMIEDFSFDTERILNILSSKFGGEWRLLVRFHPNVASLPLPARFEAGNNRLAINMTNYPEMQDLLCVSDILITDFSSTSTEFAMQKKPCFLYAPDYKTYDRGLYLTPSQMPFPFSENEQDLISSILSFDRAVYDEALSDYDRLLEMKEHGDACQRVFSYIRENYINKN